jgi:hypothetical protein
LTAVSALFQARADEGGVGMYLPGSFGSLAATPLEPGLSWATIYVHSPVSDGGNVATSRALNIGTRSTNLTTNLQADIKGQLDVLGLAPSYVFSDKVFGGQLGVSLLALYGRANSQIDANVTGALGPIGFAAQKSIEQTLWGWGDLYPQVTLRWNNGVHNFMVYGMADMPVGAYDPSRIANLGIAHWALDGGFGYTYFNPATGWEASAATGFTYNFKNPYTDYQNGIDWHLDWGASYFLTKQVHVGPVGYFYQQITDDRGAPAFLNGNRSRVIAVGPQIGFLFPVTGMQGYLNIKGYGEFGAENRASGWSAWVTLAISPEAPKPETSRRMGQGR